MQEIIDNPQTFDIDLPIPVLTEVQYPPAIAQATIIVMRSIGTIIKSERNEHGRYDYASVDDFLAMVRPACAEAGLLIKPICVSSRGVILDVVDKDGKDKKRRIIQFKFKMRLIHESGVTFTDNEDIREVWVDYTGPQCFQAAESYALKAYMRTLFQIPTGDKDEVDQTAPHSPDLVAANARAAKKRMETGKEHVSFDFGKGMEPVDIDDVKDKVTAHLTALGDLAEGKRWWGAQTTGREQLHSLRPGISQQVKKAVEAFFKSLEPPPPAKPKAPAAKPPVAGTDEDDLPFGPDDPATASNGAHA